MSQEESHWSTAEANLAVRECLSLATSKRPALPDEIILQILDDPSRWLCASRADLSPENPATLTPTPSSGPVAHVYATSATPVAQVILATAPLEKETIANLRRIVFTMHSRDQAWSSYQDDRGTYRNTWTWFEAGLQRGRDAPAAGGDPGQDFERYELQRNRHASREPETYRIEIESGHALFQSLREGDVIELLACAVYSGWANHVYHASIEIWAFDDLQRPVATLSEVR